MITFVIQNLMLEALVVIISSGNRLQLMIDYKVIIIVIINQVASITIDYIARVLTITISFIMMHWLFVYSLG